MLISLSLLFAQSEQALQPHTLTYISRCWDDLTGHCVITYPQRVRLICLEHEAGDRDVVYLWRVSDPCIRGGFLLFSHRHDVLVVKVTSHIDDKPGN